MLEELIGQLGLGDGGFTAQGQRFVRTDRFQSPVDLGVDPAHEERGDTVDGAQVTVVGLQPRQVGLDDLVVAFRRAHRPAGAGAVSETRRTTDAGDGAHAGHHEIGGNRLAGAGHDLFHRRAAPEALDGGAHGQLDAVVGVQRPVHLGHLGAEDARSGAVSGWITVTSRPIWRTEAATSAPIHPPPTSATRVAVARARRRRSASALYRR